VIRSSEATAVRVQPGVQQPARRRHLPGPPRDRIRARRRVPLPHVGGQLARPRPAQPELAHRLAVRVGREHEGGLEVVGELVRAASVDTDVVHLRVQVDLLRRRDNITVPLWQPRGVACRAPRPDAKVVAARVVTVRLEPVAGALAAHRRLHRATSLGLAHVNVVDVQRREADPRAGFSHGCADEADYPVAVVQQTTQGVRHEASPLAWHGEEGSEPHAAQQISAADRSRAALDLHCRPAALVLALRERVLTGVLAALTNDVRVHPRSASVLFAARRQSGSLRC